MIEKLSPEELDFLDILNYPIAMSEVLFSDLDNLSSMEDDKFSNVRLGQFPLISSEYLIDDNPELNEKQNFKMKKGAGDLYCMGGRLFGKTLFVEKVDLLLTLLLSENITVGFSSYDHIHIRGVLEDVIQPLEHHPIFRMFKPSVTRSPNYRIRMGSVVVDGVNMNITGKKPGAQFFQKHFHKLYIEECSFETLEVYKMRRDSVSENGCIFRIAGMTNFTKYSPCGQKFYDLDNRHWVLNLPQYINPKWDDKERLKAIKDFNGEQSIGYRIFIKGEVVEEGVSVFDMERVRRHYTEKRKLKVFEVSKEQYPLFKSILKVERPNNAEGCYIFADVGESAPSEIGINFEVNGLYKYTYNITLYNLTDKEQFLLFKWLGEELKATVIALDCTDGLGRAIFRSLAEVFPKENLVWVAFNEKLPVDFEKHEDGSLVLKSGKPVHKEEYVSEWSIQHLKTLLYNGRIELPIDYKFDNQINQVIAMQSGVRTVYSCLAEENHLFQAFQVFSIAQWYNAFNLLKPINRKQFSKLGV